MKKSASWFFAFFLSITLAWSETAKPVKPEALSEQKLLEYWRQSRSLSTAVEQAPAELNLPTTTGRLLAKAAPDECFAGAGNPYPPGPPCAVGIPKVNQAYVWGLAKAGPNIWFGTMSNTHCTVIGSFIQAVSGASPPLLQTPSWVCEFADSQYSPPLPALLGDVRTPRIYMYNTTTDTLANMTPLADPRMLATIGIRAAGALGDVVLLGGLVPTPGGFAVSMFAFRGDTGTYLGSTILPAYSSIRKFLVHEGVLYLGMGKAAGGGAVLRWTGSQASPFTFTVVGNLDGEAAELASHEGRLFISTWPAGWPMPGAGEAGLYMGPTVPPGGLTAAHAALWTKIWTASDYEPNALTAMTYGGGALASFDGYLYWGTMHVVGVATAAHFLTYGSPTNPEQAATTFLGAERALTIFRGANLASATPTFEVVYGMPALPMYVPPGPDPVLQPGYWRLVPNRMGATPLWGPAGFGNPFNNYTWSMQVYGGRLWVGTMDFGYLLKDIVSMFLGALNLPFAFQVPLQPTLFGADLFYFPSSSSPAFPESLSGVGNYTNYGIRNMIADGGKLYLGTANPMNLMTNPADALPEGGWELIELTTKPPNTPIGKTVTVKLPNGAEVTFCEVEETGYTGSLNVPNSLNLDVIPLSLGFSKPAEFVLLESSAAWRLGTCTDGSLGTVCMAAANSNQRMFQLQYHPHRGFFWMDITHHNAAGQVCGDINRQFIGAVALMEPIPVPTIGEWGLVFLAAALLVWGAVRLQRLRTGSPA